MKAAHLTNSDLINVLGILLLVFVARTHLRITIPNAEDLPYKLGERLIYDLILQILSHTINLK